MTCRSAILTAARELSRAHPEETFSVQNVVQWMRDSGSRYSDAEVRLHVHTLMCRNARTRTTDGADYQDLERVARGRYRLL
ncbi:DUF7669 domain-containing protein [Deinococcus radiotolerans]|uniref:DUF7669 domain-containing protein n=1 Tax=Deinococcus radiotolerans TaxID=1309407 RepID=UPI00402B2AF0